MLLDDVLDTVARQFHILIGCRHLADHDFHLVAGSAVVHLIVIDDNRNARIILDAADGGTVAHLDIAGEKEHLDASRGIADDNLDVTGLRLEFLDGHHDVDTPRFDNRASNGLEMNLAPQGISKVIDLNVMGIYLVDFAQGLGVAEDEYRVLTQDQGPIERIALARLSDDVSLDGHLLAGQVSIFDVDGLRQHTDDGGVLVQDARQCFFQVALVDLYQTVAIAIVVEAQRELRGLVEHVGKEPVSTVLDRDGERVRHFGKQMDILGQIHLYRHLNIELHIAVKGQETPENGRNADKRQVEQNRPRSRRLLQVVAYFVPEFHCCVVDGRLFLDVGASLGYVLHRLIDGVLVNLDAYAVGNLQNHCVVLDLADAAIDTASGHHLVAVPETVTKGVDLLLLLLLRSNHEEIENGDQGNNHDHAAPA